MSGIVKHTSIERGVAYVVSRELIAASSKLPSNKQRSPVVHSLIHALGLSKRVKVIRPFQASLKDLELYHTRDYIEAVYSNVPSESDSDFGLDDDCPRFSGLPEYVSLVAGATLTATQALIKRVAPVVICWDGGRHHARKSQAAGFCYVADCVLALMTLKRSPPLLLGGSKPRILYVDLDLHFSDGVSEAFSRSSTRRTPQILILSIHHASSGFYPPSVLSGIPDHFSPSFDPFTLSIPLHAGAGTATFARMWSLVEQIKQVFVPDYLVIQCGVDALAGDPCAVTNWDLGGMTKVVENALSWSIPTLLLGGGGYNTPNAARAWASLTSVAIGHPLPLDTPIPDHDHFPQYAPSFTLDVPAGMMQDKNTEASLQEIEGCYANVISILKETMARSVAAVN